MTATTGQLVRRVGLIVELLGVIGMVSYRRDGNERAVAGVDVWYFLAGGIALGFVLWLIGTVAIWRGRE